MFQIEWRVSESVDNKFGLREKTHKKYFCVWLPHATFTNKFSLLTKCFDKKRLITTRHRDKHFCSRSFWATNFFCQQGNLQNWCWQQDVLNQARSCAQDSRELSLPKWERESLLAMNFAPFLEFKFFFCYSICMGILARAATLTRTETKCSPSSLRNSLIQPNHDYWLLLSWILKVFWDISFSQWSRRFLTKHFL